MDPSGHFVFYEILCSSNFFCRTSPRCCSRGSPGKKNIESSKIFNFGNLKTKYRSFQNF